MRTVIVAINSKYIHTALAPWYLKAACGNGCGEIEIVESTINDLHDNILAAIYRHKPDIIAFSCYIWNISIVLRLAEDAKKVLKDSVVILGGPEVSFDCAQLLEEHSFVDYVLSGEGELSFPKLIKQITSGSKDFDTIEGLTWRSSEGIVSRREYALVDNLNDLPSPYTDEMLGRIKKRIAYYEASRGCPFSCSYCISSTFNGVRFFSTERVVCELERLIGAGVKQVKFVDRTFNCNRKRAAEIFDRIIEKWGGMKDPVNFHFEAAADLFNDEMVKKLALVPEGVFQFEIGVQSTFNKTLEAVNRKTDLKNGFKYIKALLDKGNIHIHLDLIAGLPYEDYATFKDSFNEVYRLFPHQLQLGFLKLLKGSDMRRLASEHGYAYKSYPPYEVLSNNYISYDEILELKHIEELVERYYNSGRYNNTLRYLLDNSTESPFEFYRKLMIFCHKKGYLDQSVSSKEQLNILMEFFLENGEYDSGKLNELIKLDFLSSDNTGKLPDKIEKIRIDNFKERSFEFLKNADYIRQYLPNYIGKSAKEIYKRVHFEIFKVDSGDLAVYLFDYATRNRVTGLYKYSDITENF